MRRYGESLLKAQELVKSALDRFVRVYDAQARGEASETPKELHMRLGLDDMAQQDGYSFVREHGVSDQLAAAGKSCLLWFATRPAGSRLDSDA